MTKPVPGDPPFSNQILVSASLSSPPLDPLFFLRPLPASPGLLQSSHANSRFGGLHIHDPISSAVEYAPKKGGGSSNTAGHFGLASVNGQITPLLGQTLQPHAFMRVLRPSNGAGHRVWRRARPGPTGSGLMCTGEICVRERHFSVIPLPAIVVERPGGGNVFTICLI